MIRFCCEQCGYKISVRDKHAGKHGKCPECGTVFIVPAESATIELTCENCGQKINVPKTYAGKKVKCPTCKFILEIPTRLTEPAGSPGIIRFVCTTCNQPIEEPESSRGKLIPCPHCSAFTAVPLPVTPVKQVEASVQPDKDVDESEEQFEQLQIGSIREFKQKPTVVTERKLPWILDIFLFPTSLSGLSVLAIIVLTRFFFRVTVLYLGEASRQFLPCLAFFGLMFGLGIIARIVIYMYLCWYLCECIRGSAAGGGPSRGDKGLQSGSLGDVREYLSGGVVHRTLSDAGDHLSECDQKSRHHLLVSVRFWVGLSPDGFYRRRYLRDITGPESRARDRLDLQHIAAVPRDDSHVRRGGCRHRHQRRQSVRVVPEFLYHLARGRLSADGRGAFVRMVLPSLRREAQLGCVIFQEPKVEWIQNDIEYSIWRSTLFNSLGQVIDNVDLPEL